ERPFNIAQPPLVRAAFVRCSAERSWLVVTAHPLCADERTLANLANEIARAYDACATGVEREEPVQYLQYCEYQRQLRAGAEVERVSGVSVTVLPGDLHGRATGETAVEEVALDDDQVVALERRARANGVEIDDVLLAAWQTLIARLAGGEIAIG